MKRLVTLMSPFAVPLSPVLRVAAAGEVAKNKKYLRRQGQILFHYLLKHTPFALKIYLTVPLFVAMFRVHADDGNNPLYLYPLHTAGSLAYVVIIICNLQIFL